MSHCKCAAQTTNPPTLPLTRRRSPLTPSLRHPSLPPVFQTVLKHFPTALSVDDYITRVEIALAGYGFTGDNSIAMTNLCRDEVRGSGGTGAVPRCRRGRPCLALLMVAPCLLLGAAFLLQCMGCALKLAAMLGRSQGSRGHKALGGVVGSREYCRYSLPARPCSGLGRQALAGCTALLLAAKPHATATTTVRPSGHRRRFLPSHPTEASLSLLGSALLPHCLVTPPPPAPQSCMILEDKIESVFGSCFSTHGLGGILTCGVIGIKAGLSHSPIQGVSACCLMCTVMLRLLLPCCCTLGAALASVHAAFGRLGVSTMCA